jgi:hypothetical protein
MWGGPPGPLVPLEASMHVAASIPNFVIMEEGNKETAEYKDIFTGGWKATLAHWEIPDGPGLGVNISPEFLRNHEVKATGGQAKRITSNRRFCGEIICNGNKSDASARRGSFVRGGQEDRD